MWIALDAGYWIWLVVAVPAHPMSTCHSAVRCSGCAVTFAPSVHETRAQGWPRLLGQPLAFLSHLIPTSTQPAGDSVVMSFISPRANRAHPAHCPVDFRNSRLNATLSPICTVDVLTSETVTWSGTRVATLRAIERAHRQLKRWFSINIVQRSSSAAE